MRKNNVFLLIVIIAIAILLYYFRASAEPVADTQPPSIQNLTFTPKVADVGQTVVAMARITDATGLREAGISVSDSFLNQYVLFGFAATERISGTAQDGTYRTTFILPPNTTLGQWNVDWMTSRDTVGNEKFFQWECPVDPQACIPASNARGFLVIEKLFIPILKL